MCVCVCACVCVRAHVCFEPPPSLPHIAGSGPNRFRHKPAPTQTGSGPNRLRPKPARAAGIVGDAGDEPVDVTAAAGADSDAAAAAASEAAAGGALDGLRTSSPLCVMKDTSEAPFSFAKRSEANLVAAVRDERYERSSL